jgi:hypothetical protein
MAFFRAVIVVGTFKFFYGLEFAYIYVNDLPRQLIFSFPRAQLQPSPTL